MTKAMEPRLDANHSPTESSTPISTVPHFLWTSVRHQYAHRGNGVPETLAAGLAAHRECRPAGGHRATPNPHPVNGDGFVDEQGGVAQPLPPCNRVGLDGGLVVAGITQR